MANLALDELRAKKVLVVGLGVQGGGVGLVKYLLESGAQVTVTDLKTGDQLQESLDKLHDLNIQFALGGHKAEDFLNADIIFKGPSVPWNLPEIKNAQEKGIPVEMEVSFFAAHCPAKIIGITGTRGKSTTTQLIYEILIKLSEKKVHIGGNVPDKSTISLLNDVSKDDLVVLELSSWALSGLHRKKISPHVGVFTNFYPDHMNYYKSEEDYLYDKKAIYLYQTDSDYLVANKQLEEKIKPDNPKSKISYFDNHYEGKLKLKGEHNKENAAAALEVAKILGLNEQEVKNVIANFKGLSFREEVIAQKNGVTVINDTTSTTPVATVKALDSFSDKPTVLILGGNSKNLPFDILINNLDKVNSIILLKGTFTDEIKTKIPSDKIIGEFDDLEQAVKSAYDKAKELGDSYLLFSPGATSFAMFKNEFDRGRVFNQIVEKL